MLEALGMLAWWTRQQPRPCLTCNGEVILYRRGDEWRVCCTDCGGHMSFAEYRQVVDSNKEVEQFGSAGQPDLQTH